jgi:excisionase family DNA binding protein
VGQAEQLVKSWMADVIKNAVPTPEPSPVFFNRGEVARILKISLPTLDTYVRENLIPVKKVGNRFLFTKEDIDSALTAPTFRKYKRRAV